MAVTREGTEGAFGVHVRPGIGLSEIEFGMKLEQVVGVMSEYGIVEPFRRTPDENEGLCVSTEEFSIFVYSDEQGRVGEIEVSDGIPVILNSIDLLGLPAHEVLELLRGRWEVQESVDEPGHSYEVPQLGIAFWRAIVPEDETLGDDEDSFESVLLSPVREAIAQ